MDYALILFIVKRGQYRVVGRILLYNTLNKVTSLAYFCSISSVTLMMKFGGFKASLNIFNSKRHSKDNEEFEPGLCISGAYRTNRDEYFGNDRVYEPPKRLTPSMVKLPECQNPTLETIRPSKSSGDLTKPNNLPANLRYSTPSVSLDPRGEEERPPRNSRNGQSSVPLTAKQEKEQAKVRKKQLAEQKARDKLAAKERVKQEKLQKAREKKEAQDKAKRNNKEKKLKSPVERPQQQQQQPQQSTSSTTTTAVAQQKSANPLAQESNYSTNTLDSSISKSSGPPPYTEVPNTRLNAESVAKTEPKPVSVKKTAPQPQPVQKENQTTSDVIFSEPIDTGSWDMIIQHRQQVSKTTKTTMVQSKQRVMDLNYNLHSDKDNTDA